jgi:hypothetical protein
VLLRGRGGHGGARELAGCGLLGLVTRLFGVGSVREV